MSADTAKKMFDENFRLFSNDVEKFNLYKGLSNLAAAIGDIEDKVDSIEMELDSLKNKIK